MIVSRLRVDPPGCDLCSARGDVLVQGDRAPIALCWLCARKLLDHLDAFVTDEDKPPCWCTHEAGDSPCERHPTCAGCGLPVRKLGEGCGTCEAPSDDRINRGWRTGCARAVEPSAECTCGMCVARAS